MSMSPQLTVSSLFSIAALALLCVTASVHDLADAGDTMPPALAVQAGPSGPTQS